MIFSSSTFLFVFLPIVMAGYFLLHPRFRNVFLLLSSLVFYAWGEPKFVLIMLFSIFMNWAAAYFIDLFKNKKILRKVILWSALFLNLAILFVFKYLNFVISNLNRIAEVFPQTNIALPIGISFFTFQALSYVVDVYRGTVQVQKNPLNIGLYISFFPQLIAGPIVRYKTIAAEIADRETKWSDFSVGVERFLRGMFKKILLANNMAVVADVAFATAPENLSVLMAWVGALAYTMQIFFDFSGYSDMAIGLGRIFGFHFDENFDYPYISRSVTEFWRRWHMSLGTWFRDYVYFPLGGSRVATKGKHIRNLFVVWLLTGLWHGASWNFVVWGLMYFVLLVLEKFVVHPEKMGNSSVARYVWQVFSMLCVVAGWVLFRANGLRSALRYGLTMLGVGSVFSSNADIFYGREYLVLFMIALICCTPVVSRLKKKIDTTKWAPVADCVKAFAYFGMLLMSMSYLVMGAHNPFIYFNF